MKPFVCLWLIGFSVLITQAQFCSETYKLSANSSRLITLASDSASICLAQLNSEGEIEKLQSLPLGKAEVKTENHILNDNVYAGHCSQGKNFHLFYFKPEDSETFTLRGITGNSHSRVAQSSDGITKFNCGRKELPNDMYVIANTQGLYCCIPSYTIGKTTVPMQLMVLNQSFQPIKEKKLSLPYGDNTLETIQILPDSMGNFYILSKQKIIARSKNIPSRYFLFYYNFQRNALKEYDLQIQGRNIAGACLQNYPDGTIVLAGIYSDDMTMEAAGTFYSQINAAGGSMNTIQTCPFNALGMDLFSGQRPNKIVIPDLMLEGILADSTGLFIWGERRYSTDHSGIDPLTGRVYNEIRHHNDQLIVVRLDSNGQLISNSVIEKQQTTPGETLYLSYHAFQTDDSIAFAFNDNPANRNESGARDYGWSSSRNFITTLAVVSPKGKLSYSTIFEKEEMRIVPRLCLGNKMFRAEGKSVRVCTAQP